MRVLVIGSGAAVERELSTIDRAAFDKIIGVNRAAVLYGPVDIHCSLHPREYAQVKAGWFVSHDDSVRGVDEVFPCLWRPGGNSGSSGLYAVKYALGRLEADEVILAGVGMDYGPHIYNPSNWPQAPEFQRTWIEEADKLRGRVRSLGGWTAQLLNGDTSP